MENIIVSNEIYNEEYYKKSNKIGKITIIMNHDDFNKELIKGKKDELSTKIIKEVKKFKSSKCFEITVRIEHGSIEAIMEVTAIAGGVVYVFANYDNAKNGFSSFIKDIRNNRPKIMDACLGVLKSKKEKEIMDEYIKKTEGINKKTEGKDEKNKSKNTM